MRTSLLMTVSAMTMFILGIGLTFLPQETLVYLGIDPVPMMVLLLQVTGALYLGFALLNWTARASLIGGIYSRPVAIGNFAHFLVAAITLVRFVIGGERSIFVILITVVYAVLAGWFALVLFTHPIRAKSD